MHLALGRGMRVVKPTLLAFLIALAPALCGNIRQDEFLCEEAFAHLKECCPELSKDLYLCDYAAGCDGEVHNSPALGVDASNCIREMSCDALVASGVCTRAAALPEGFVPGTPGVCP